MSPSSAPAIDKFLNAIQTASIPACDACSRQLGTVASSVASALHASHAGMLAVWMALRNWSTADDITAS